MNMFYESGPRPVDAEHDPHEVADVLNTIFQILAVSGEIMRRDKVYPNCLRQLNKYQFANSSCRFNSREETHVYLPPRWTKYLRSQNLYGKKL